MPTSTKPPKPVRECWVCGRRTRKYIQSHHVMGATNDPDLTVFICRGCHYLETLLARFKRLLTDARALARLITLARLHAGMPDAETHLRYKPTGKEE